MDFLKIAFFLWTACIFASQAVIVFVSIYYGDISGWVYIVACVSSAITFILCFAAKLLDLSWSFEWGVCFPLVGIYSLEVYATACFISWEPEELMGYLTICLALTLFTLSLTLLGLVVYCSCKTMRIRWCQRPGQPTRNIQSQVLYPTLTVTNDDHDHLSLPRPYAACFIPQSSILLQSFDQVHGSPIIHAPPPARTQTDDRSSRNRLNLTIRTDVAVSRAAYLILSPLGAPPPEIGSLERGIDTEMKSLGGCIKGEADRRFVAESSPKKHVRIGRGRDLA